MKTRLVYPHKDFRNDAERAIKAGNTLMIIIKEKSKVRLLSAWLYRLPTTYESVVGSIAKNNPRKLPKNSTMDNFSEFWMHVTMSSLVDHTWSLALSYGYEMRYKIRPETVAIIFGKCEEDFTDFDDGKD